MDELQRIEHRPTEMQMTNNYAGMMQNQQAYIFQAPQIQRSQFMVDSLRPNESGLSANVNFFDYS
jgi:hypothetical protein